MASLHLKQSVYLLQCVNRYNNKIFFSLRLMAKNICKVFYDFIILNIMKLYAFQGWAKTCYLQNVKSKTFIINLQGHTKQFGYIMVYISVTVLTKSNKNAGSAFSTVVYLISLKMFFSYYVLSISPINRIRGYTKYFVNITVHDFFLVCFLIVF